MKQKESNKVKFTTHAVPVLELCVLCHIIDKVIIKM